MSAEKALFEGSCDGEQHSFPRTFKDLHDLFFKAKKVRFNKYIHKKNHG